MAIYRYGYFALRRWQIGGVIQNEEVRPELADAEALPVNAQGHLNIR
jgi:hypothetical protein